MEQSHKVDIYSNYGEKMGTRILPRIPQEDEYVEVSGRIYQVWRVYFPEGGHHPRIQLSQACSVARGSQNSFFTK
ncbi:MAG TPA: hypothetical protein VEA59_03015 [Patescibacteria group bacterium]|nr:hypothetical protein [Patescibacteria group bacterium]